MEINLEQMIGQGNTAEIFRLEDKKILKLFRTGLNREIIEREFQNAIIVQEILKCVPRAYEMATVQGRLGIVYEEIQGTDMLKIMAKHIWRVNDYAKRLARCHRTIHKPVSNELCSVKEKLKMDINSVQELSGDKKEKIKNYLKQLPEGEELCHFDFHPGNIMMDNGSEWILDWMTASRGDSCADVSRTCLMLKYGEVPHASWIERKIISAIQRHIYKIYIKEYLTISQKSMEDVTRWELPIAAARLREWIPESEKKVLMRLVEKNCL